MTSRVPGARRGAHRSRRDVAGALVPSLLAVLAVTALVTALIVWRGEDPGTTPRATAATDRDTTAPMTSGSAPATTTPASGPASPATSPAATSRPTESRTDDLIGSIEVVVLNQTRRSGLAAAVAERLRDEGWTVPTTGNFRGQVPATTVYYPAGAEDEARAVAAGLPTERRVRPRFSNLSRTRLTVVVTDSYPS